MVGRLVKYDQVGLLQQELPQRHTGLLSAGESGDRFLKLRLLKAQPLKDSRNFAFISVAVPCFKSVGEGGILLHQPFQLILACVLHGDFTFPYPLLQVYQLLLDGQQLLINCISRVHGVVLRKVAQGFVLGERHQTAVRGHFTHDDAQERGFSGAVDAYDSRLFVILNMEADIFQHLVFRKFLRYILNGEYHDHMPFLVRAVRYPARFVFSLEIIAFLLPNSNTSEIFTP